jgi:hypothetical protein
VFAMLRQDSAIYFILCSYLPLVSNKQINNLHGLSLRGELIFFLQIFGRLQFWYERSASDAECSIEQRLLIVKAPLGIVNVGQSFCLC